MTVAEVITTQQVVITETAVNVLEVLVPAAPAVVQVVAEGPQGPSAAKARRHDWADPYDYLGTAPLGTADGAAAWRITRLTVSAAGAVTASGTATAVTWTGRAGHTYT